MFFFPTGLVTMAMGYRTTNNYYNKNDLRINETCGTPQVHGGGQSQPAPLCVPALRRGAQELRGHTAGPAGGQDGPGERAAQVQPGSLP